MDKALLVLRQYTTGAELLLCGVPIAPAWGKTDFCHIGNDIHIDWEFAMLKTLKVPERPSNYLSLQNTMARFIINSKGFMNDPDVFILRDSDQKMDFEERKTLFLINWLMGALVFTSDKIEDYNSDQKKICSIFMDDEDPVIMSSKMDERMVYIDFHY